MSSSFINVEIDIKRVLCKICKVRVGNFCKAAGCMSIHRYAVLRVEPFNFVSVCSPSSDYDISHGHMFFSITTEKSISEKSSVPRLINFKDEEPGTGICKFSTIARHLQNLHPEFRSTVKRSDVAVQVDIPSIVVLTDEAEDFIQRFYSQLLKQPTTSSDMYSIGSIRLAMEAAKGESSVESARLAMETVKNKRIGKSGGRLNIKKDFVLAVDKRFLVCKKVTEEILFFRFVRFSLNCFLCIRFFFQRKSLEFVDVRKTQDVAIDTSGLCHKVDMSTDMSLFG